MKVCIAEKPSVAREIAFVVGAKNRKEGYYEGNGYQVTWTFGHFCTLREPEDYNPKWKRWSIYDLPMLPDRFGIKLLNDKGVQKQFAVIKNLLASATEVINCGDAGQEGEVIQRWVLTEARYSKPFKRLWISSLTEDAIRQGFAKLKEGSDFDLLYQAGKSRAIGDWLLGINGTRLFSMKYGQGRQLLSIGRVQTPTLAMIVNRHHEIMNFKPEPFWELKTVYRDTTFSSTEGKFTKKEKADKILESIKAFDLVITDSEIKKGIESPPKLFDLTSLQIECNNKLGLSADQTLKTIQGLYEKKLVTYPRVDTTFLPDDMYPKIPEILKGLSGYNPYTSFLLESKIRKSKKVFNNNKVTDHHAIVPTGAAASFLIGYDAGVYDLIVKRFLAAFYPDCIVSNTTILADINENEFRVKGKQILEPGWRVVFEKDKEEPKKQNDSKEKQEEDLAVLPLFEKGEHGPHEPVLEQKMTSPPKEFTEATLLRAMETAGKQMEDDDLKEALKENGIGRPSTRAAIIETLFKRHYIKKDKKKILPTPMGIDLIGVIRNPTLKSAELTGQWEQKLRQIEAGIVKPDDFLHELKTLVYEMVTEVKTDNASVTLEESTEPVKSSPDSKILETKKNSTSEKNSSKTKKLGTCPACKQGEMLKGTKGYGCSRWKEGCKFVILIEQAGKKITDTQLSALIRKGKTGLIKGFTEGGSSAKFDAFLVLNAENKLVFEKNDTKTIDPFEVCPKCKSGKILKGKSAYGCSRFREGCNFLIPFELAGKTLTDKTIESILLKGKTGKIKGFVSPKTGNTFEAALLLNSDFKVVFKFD